MQITLTPSQFVWLVERLEADHADYLTYSRHPDPHSPYAHSGAYASQLREYGRQFDDDELRAHLRSFIGRLLRNTEGEYPVPSALIARLTKLANRLDGYYDYPQLQPR